LSKNLASAVKFLFFFGVGFAILYFLYQNQNAAYLEECALKGIPDVECNLLDKIIEDFKTVKLAWVALILILFVISNIIRSVRWQAMLKTLGHKPSFFNCFAAVSLGYFANLGIPRLGEFIRPATVTRYEKIPIEHSFGTIVAERIIDVVCLLIAIILGILLGGPRISAYLQENTAITAQQIYILIGVGIAGGIVALLLFRYILKSESDNKIFKFVKEKLAGFSDGLKSFAQVKNKSLFIGQSIAIWILYYLMTYLCFNAYAPTENLGAIAGLVVFVFGSLGIVFPSPGGMGSYHFMISQSLILYGIGGIEAFTFANIIFFSLQIFCNVLIGILSLLLLPIINRS